jgi:hypothetical protein
MATITITENITDDVGGGMSASTTFNLGTSVTQLYQNVFTVSHELRLFAEFGNSEQGAPIKLDISQYDGFFGAIINRSKTQNLLVRLGQSGSSEYFDTWVSPESFYILPQSIDESGSIYYASTLGDLKMRFENVQEQAEVVLLTYAN